MNGNLVLIGFGDSYEFDNWHGYSRRSNGLGEIGGPSDVKFNKGWGGTFFSSNLRWVIGGSIVAAVLSPLRGLLKICPLPGLRAPASRLTSPRAIISPPLAG